MRMRALRVHVPIHRAVGVAPLAESYLVFATVVSASCTMEKSEDFMLSITTGRGRTTRHAFRTLVKVQVPTEDRPGCRHSHARITWNPQ